MDDRDKALKARIDELVEEFKSVENWNEILPNFDDESLMVHWTNNGTVKLLK